MKSSPEIIITTDKKLDKEMIFDFAEENVSVIYRVFPKINTVKSEADKKEVISEIVDNRYSQDIAKIDEVSIFLSDSKPIFNIVIRRLCEIMETDWDSDKSITIIPCLCPIFPRFIESNSFMVSYRMEREDIFRVCIHEITHFIYFKKILELNPKITRKELEMPHDVWKISELLAPVIVNDAYIQKQIHIKDYHYKHWQGIKIDGKTMLECLTAIYDKREGFSDLINKANEFFLKNEISAKLQGFDTKK